MALSPTTKLEAVNIMLGTVGQAPVSSLTSAPLTDVAVAQSVLDEVTKAVQVRGWYFNTDTDYPLSPDVNGWIQVPSDALRVDPSDRTKRIVVRRNKLWDKDNLTDVFAEAVKVDIVWALDFEDLPEPARRLVTIRAARIFQERLLGSTTLSTFTEQDEQLAMAELLRDELEAADTNMLMNRDTIGVVDRTPTSR